MQLEDDTLGFDTHTHAYTHRHTHTHARAHTHTDTHTHTHTHSQTHTHKHAHTHTRTHTRAHTHAHTQAKTQTGKNTHAPHLAGSTGLNKKFCPSAVSNNILNPAAVAARLMCFRFRRNRNLIRQYLFEKSLNEPIIAKARACYTMSA